MLKAALAELDTRPPPKVGRRRTATDADPDVLATGKGRSQRKPAGPGAVAEARAVFDRHLAEATARLSAWEAKAAGGRPVPGRKPGPPQDHRRVRLARQNLEKAEQAAADHAAARAELDKNRQVNLTDPDSRTMPTRNGWVQGYNAQLVSTDDHFVLACALTQDTDDLAQYQPVVDLAVAAATALPLNLARHRPARIGLVTADNGYWTPAAATAPGPDRLIATANRRDLARAPAPTGPPPQDATPLQAMTHRLAAPEGRTAYKRRSATVEPVIGHLKDQVGLRRFRRRGLTHAAHELTLACTVHNLRRLHNVLTGEPTTTAA